MIHKEIAAETGQRTLLITDVHGCFDELQDNLSKLNYDPFKDILISLGDLIDRGEQSLKCLELFLRDSTGLKHSLIGNHEQFMIDKNIDLHLYNGGQWIIEDLPTYEERMLIGSWIKYKFSYAITLKSGNKTFGLVHAAVPLEFESWDDFVDCLHASSTLREECLWQREFVEYKNHKYYKEQFVDGVDFTIHGHTPVKEPTTVANRLHIDLGTAYKKHGYGKMCIIEIIDGVETVNVF